MEKVKWKYPTKKRNNLIYCKGVTYNREICGESKQPYHVACTCEDIDSCTCGKNKVYCTKHSYQENFTKEELDAIVDSTSPYVFCVRCSEWKKYNFTKSACNECNNKTKEREKEKRNQRKDCCVLIKKSKDSDSFKCTDAVLGENSFYYKNGTKEKIYPMKLLLEKYEKMNSKFCEMLKNNNVFCSTHLQRYIDEMYENKKMYTEDEVQNFKWCSTCKNYLNPEKFTGNMCNKCKGICDENRNNEKEEKKKHDRCKEDDCDNEAIKYKLNDKLMKEIIEKQNLPKIYQEYCGKHQLQGFVDEVVKSKKKVCKNYERGCRQILDLDDSTFCSKCRNARQIKESQDLQRRIRSYKNNAKQRNITFNLTDEQCVEFFKSQCRVCNNDNIDELFCGIDRIDNKKGYSKENCRPCCIMCNFMKGSKDDVFFLKKAEYILNNWKIIKTEIGSVSEEFSDHRSSNYSRYKKNASEKKLPFELSQDEFNIITQSNCYLCNKESNQNNLNGVDRVDNMKGYINGNVLPCCMECNLMKHANEIHKFIHKLYDVYVTRNNIKKKLPEENLNTIIEKHLKNEFKKIKEKIDASDDKEEEIVKVKINNKRKK
jgi:hypothetical protein